MGNDSFIRDIVKNKWWVFPAETHSLGLRRDMTPVEGIAMIKFGTGGWRAIIGEDFTKANVQLLAQALAELIKAENAGENGFVIGFDRRFCRIRLPGGRAK